ncbi:MAG: DbpA RNA binding domain-containing protein, partial [Candidatus Hydrogenedentota bacterium]
AANLVFERFLNKERPEAPRKKEREQKPRPPAHASQAAPSRKRKKESGIRMERYRIDVGSNDGALPGEIAGIISNAAGLERRYIGNIDISDDMTFIELPEGMPPRLCRELKNLPIAGKISNFSPASPRRK